MNCSIESFAAFGVAFFTILFVIGIFSAVGEQRKYNKWKRKKKEKKHRHYHNQPKKKKP